MANVICHNGRSALVLALNKTLAEQLCNELLEFASRMQLSTHPYYSQPEVDVPFSRIYIANTASSNE